MKFERMLDESDAQELHRQERVNKAINALSDPHRTIELGREESRRRQYDERRRQLIEQHNAALVRISAPPPS